MLYTLIALFITCAVMWLLLFLNKKKNLKINVDLITKIFCIAIFVFTAIKTVNNDGFILVINKGYLYEIYCDKTDVPETIFRWLILWAEILSISLLVSKNKLVEKLLFYIGVPGLILASFFIKRSIGYYSLNTYEYNLWFSEPIVAIGLICEYAVLLLLPLINYFFGPDFKEKMTKEEKVKATKLGVFSAFICIPFLSYRAIFGSTTIELNFGTIAQVFWLLSIVEIFFIMYYFFHKETIENRYTILSVMVLYLFIHFNSSFKCGYASNRLPLQLCNLASYIFVLLLFVRSQKIFDFIYVANPIGALVAIATLSTTGYIFEFWVIHYVVQHTWVFIIPFLFISLGFYKRPKLKEMIPNFMIGFTIYYFFCFFYNVGYNNLIYGVIDYPYITDVNFFFLLRCPVEDVLPFYKDLIFFGFRWGNVEYWIPYMAFIYVVFSSLSLLLFLFTEGVHKISRKLKLKIVRKKSISN